MADTPAPTPATPVPATTSQAPVAVPHATEIAAPAVKEAKSPDRHMAFSVMLFLIILSVLFLGFVLIVAFARKSLSDEVAVPLLLVGGIGIFLCAISAVTAVFWRLDLSSKNFALGLPDGSVRAVIALSLILLFAIMSVFLYLNINKNTGATDLAKQLITTLATLVVSLASFYFGANTVASAHKGDTDASK